MSLLRFRPDAFCLKSTMLFPSPAIRSLRSTEQAHIVTNVCPSAQNFLWAVSRAATTLRVHLQRHRRLTGRREWALKFGYVRVVQ